MYLTKNNISGLYGPEKLIQWNLWIATLRNEDILWKKDTSSGPKLLFSVHIALWNEDTSELETLLARPKGVLISQVSLYAVIVGPQVITILMRILFCSVELKVHLTHEAVGHCTPTV
jgi:hypothetical protein